MRAFNVFQSFQKDLMNKFSEKNYYLLLKGTSKYILKFLMLLLVLSMLFASIDLAHEFYIKIISSPFGYFKVHDLYSFFSLILIVAVGYELLKSINYIIGKSQIPVRAILKISMIAIANKVITLDIHEASMELMIGIGVLIIALGIAYFMHHYNSSNSVDLND